MGPDGLLLPRLETGAHRAVKGSYGVRAAEWLSDVYGLTLRGWQRYALERILEHDAQGELVWRTAVITVARQSGKSYLTRALCLWRMHEGRELWGEEQTIIHVANKRETAMEVMRPAGLWAEETYGKRTTRWGAARAGIDLPTGDRWIIHAANASAGVGFSTSMVFVDEAWQVERTVVDDGLAPTMLERTSPQLVLVSTAGDSTSDLLLSYRQRAIDDLGSESPGILLLEWSAPPDADPDLVETWRWASPEWTERREEFLRAQSRNIEPAAFSTQYLNQWVARVHTWLPDATWHATESDLDLPADQPWHVAVADDFDGMGHAVAIAAQADDRIVIRATIHRTIPEVDARLEAIRAEHPALTVFATPLYRDRLRTPFTLVGSSEAAAGTQILYDAFERRVIAHDGDVALREHFHQSTISKRQGGWMLTAPMGKAGVHGARAVMFAVWAASKVQKPAPAIHVRRGA